MKEKKLRYFLQILGILLLSYLVFALCSCILQPRMTHRTAQESPVTLESQPDTEQFLCIDDNQDALLWRLRAIASAQQRIALSTFELAPDHCGMDLMSALKAAADRGVQVQLLVDGGLGLFNLSKSDIFQALAATENVEIQFYNPFSFLRPWQANYRLHDKYLLVDDNIYILGGRNIVDRFIGNYTEDQNVDRDLLIYTSCPEKTTSQDQVLQYFTTIWTNPANKPVKAKHTEDTVQAAAALDARYQALHEEYPQVFDATNWQSETTPAHHIKLLTNPCQAMRKEPVLWDALQPILTNGQNITLQTPYIICDTEMYNRLTALADNRTLHIVTNAVENGANPWGCADYLTHKNKILSTGAHIFEYAGGDSLHAKTVLVDDNVSLVGSYNLDMRSTYLNTEMMLYVDSPELNAHLRNCIAENQSHSRSIAPDGTETAGPAFNPPPLQFAKRILYGIIQVISLPVRHLL